MACIQQQATVTISNNSQADQILREVHSWDPLKTNATYPQQISPFQSYKFQADGFMQGAVYKGTNVVAGAGNYDCAWLFAYKVNGYKNKVYAQCGKLSDFTSVDWDVIKGLLEASSNSFIYVDSRTKIKAQASIDDNGFNPDVSISFGLLN